MYHYVRDLQRSRYPNIKGRTIEDFRSQIEYLDKNGTFITAAELVDAVLNNTELPTDAVMLSFDDGYIDHYTNVFPLLHDKKIEGMFFPAAEPIEKGKVLDTNKIHFILAAQPDTTKVVEEINAWFKKNQKKYDLPSTEALWAEFALPSSYDTLEVSFIKFLLQRGLKPAARNSLTDLLFNKYVTNDESAFSAELYMSEDQIKIMSQCGQYFGSHGYTHEWFDILGSSGQKTEITQSLRFLNKLHIKTKQWIMCYPYGCRPFAALDDKLRSMLTENGCALALTDHGGEANLDEDEKFFIKRIDTVELPVS